MKGRLRKIWQAGFGDISGNEKLGALKKRKSWQKIEKVGKRYEKLNTAKIGDIQTTVKTSVILLMMNHIRWTTQ